MKLTRKRQIKNNIVVHHEITINVNTSNTDFFEQTKETLVNFFKENTQHEIQMTLIRVMQKIDPATGAILVEESVPFHSKQESVFSSTNLEDLIESMKAKVLESFSIFLRNVSGWALKTVEKLEITASKLSPLKGSSHFELPEKLRNSKGVVNMNNKNDNECFKWAITRVFNPVDHNKGNISYLRE